jgi:hypothetical protein
MKRISVLIAALAALLMLLPAAGASAATEFSLELSFAGSGEGAVGCKVGAGPLEECEAEYPEGTELTILAEPELGSEFVEWVGDCDSVAGPECKVTIDADKQVEAVFDLEEFEVTLQSEGSGEGVLECQVDGGAWELCPESETYPYETELRVYAEAEFGSEFAEWKGDCEGVEVECVLIVEEELEATAIFAAEPLPEFPLEVALEGSGEGEVTSSPAGIECPVICEAEFEEGAEVTLSPSPKAGSEFSGWSGCDSEPTLEGVPACVVEMSEAKEVTASFDLEPEPESFTLSVTKVGTGSGTVTSSPAGISCGSACKASFEEGTEVTLTATPAPGSTFTGWAGACTGSAACKVTMSEALAVTATFTAIPPEKTCATDPSLCQPPPGEGIAKVAASAKVKGGKAQLKLSCTGAGACKGTLELTAKLKQGKKTKSLVIGKASFSLAQGAKATLRVKLSSPAKQALAKSHSLKAKVKGSDVIAASVKLKA